MACHPETLLHLLDEPVLPWRGVAAPSDRTARLDRQWADQPAGLRKHGLLRFPLAPALSHLPAGGGSRPGARAGLSDAAAAFGSRRAASRNGGAHGRIGATQSGLASASGGTRAHAPWQRRLSGAIIADGRPGLIERERCGLIVPTG